MRCVSLCGRTSAAAAVLVTVKAEPSWLKPVVRSETEPGGASAA